MNRFPRVMAVRLGYDPGQVDDFVRRIERTLGLGPLDGPPVTGDEIRNAKFAVKLGGYNETAVDFALDAFIVAVEAPAARTAAAPSLRTRAEERTRQDPAPAKAAGAAEPWLETQAARVERVAFRPGRLGMGYREEEVDAFLDRVVATLRGTAAEPLTAEQVRRATFATVVFRPGYAIQEVDGFLAEMANVLERRP
ncbi:DivIVA domain-containing protein [Microbispora bryophytorum]|uniref:DivIVA domain-containing protein n=1 Tax=Microbispora bryophytorum TaxID=1460882 RepID=UPI0033DDD42A